MRKRTGDTGVGPLIGRLPRVAERMRLSYDCLADPRVWSGVAGELGLSVRELQVGLLLLKGFSNQEVATALGITRGTVHTYVSKLFHKLAVRNRAELVATLVLASGVLLPRT